MNDPDRQAYDRGTSLYSPDGRIYQVEYAREAVGRGAPVVGLRAAGGVAFAAVARPSSALQERDSLEKIHKVDEHVGVGTAGHAADAARLVEVTRRAAQSDRYRYDEATDAETLAAAVSDHVQESTQAGGIRPFGSALLIGGLTDGEAELWAVGPEGAPAAWQATAIGGGSEEIQEFLDEEYAPGGDVDTALGLGVRALREAGDDVDADVVSAATITPDGFRTASHDEIADRFDAA